MKLFIFLLMLTVFTNTTYAAEAKNKATLLMDHNGKVLYQRNANRPRYPASLTKLMTAYVVFTYLSDNKISMDQKVSISKNAASQEPRKIGLQAGDAVTLKELLMSTVIFSANDSAVALAEFIGKTESGFAKIMNDISKTLNMNNTKFMNASGLHHKGHRTTANDMLRLANALHEDYPQYYNIFKQTSFKYKGKIYNGNNLITEIYEGAKGLKTGYTQKAGYNLITSAERDGTRIIGLIMGEDTRHERDLKMIDLLNEGFAQSCITCGRHKRPTPKLSRSKNIIKAFSSPPTPTISFKVS